MITLPIDLPQLKEPPAWNVAVGTRHHHLMHSNEPPLETDLAPAKKAVSDVDTRLEFLDEEITRLETLVAQLQEERTARLLYRQRNLAIFSPLRRLPPELLSEIFYWTLPNVHEERARGRIELAESPWVLSHVSSRWRAISISTPSLWFQMVIAFGENHEPWSSYPLSLIETHIQRSQKMNLTFEGCETCESKPQVQTFELLARYSSRWVEFSVELTSQVYPLLTNLRLPQLRKLWLEWSCEASEADIDCIECFETAPVLVNVGVSYQSRHIPIILSIWRLTRYSINAPWEVHRSILKLAPNLVEARICIAFDEEPWPDGSDPTIVLSSLRHLFASDLRLLNHLTTPSLEEIALEFDHADDETGPYLSRTLDDLIRRSSCPLRRLCLALCPTISAAISDFQIPASIIELAMVIGDDEGVKQINHFMLALASRPHVAGFVPQAPQLRGIHILCDKNTHIDYLRYVKMVESRWTTGTLRSASLFVSNRRWLPDLPRVHALQTLQENGLNFSMRLGMGDETVDIAEDWLFAS